MEYKLHIQQFVGAVWSPQTERGVIARLLALPLIGGIACIFAAFVAFHLGVIGRGAPQPTGVLHAVMILVAIGVIWSVACGLWYLLGFAWFMWATRQAKVHYWIDKGYEATAYLLSRLWRLPLVSASFCWIPLLTHASVIPGNVSHLALAIGLAIVQLLVTYIWIGIIRGVLRWRHGL
jgi:hypothetical protein